MCGGGFSSWPRRANPKISEEIKKFMMLDKVKILNGIPLITILNFPAIKNNIPLLQIFRLDTKTRYSDFFLLFYCNYFWWSVFKMSKLQTVKT
jgi:hypothetical protein